MSRLLVFVMPVMLLVVPLAPLRHVAADTPLALHPENPHYFQWQGRPAILITSGEHYGALLNLDFDYTVYFQTLAADDLNHTRTFSGVYREVESSFGITDNPLAPKPGRFICPWARSDQPGDFDGGNKFDLAQWDPAYFARLHDLMRQAKRHGIVVEFTLFCPMYRDAMWDACPMKAGNNIQGIGDCDRQDVYALKDDGLTRIQTELTRKIVRELNQYDNLYFEVCNEPYFGGVTRAWQDHIIETIVATERTLPRTHLISINVANGRKKVTDPHPAVSIYNFHYCVPPDTVAMNYGLDKVIGENETGFRGSADVLYRTEAWDFLLAGGGLFNNLDYSFTPPHPDGTFLQYKSPGGGSPTLRKQLKILKDFVYGLEFVRMKPVADDVRSSAELSVQALAEPGKAYAIYVHVPIPNKPKDVSKYQTQTARTTLALPMPEGVYRGEWINPRTGDTVKPARVDHPGGECRWDSPEFVTDMALRIRAE